MLPGVSYDEYAEWEPRTKLELIDGRLIVGKSFEHSRLLLSQILRGWGLEAAIALAPESLWWRAMSIAFGAAPVSSLETLQFSEQQRWAADVSFEPDAPKMLSQWSRKRGDAQELLHMSLFRLAQQHKGLGRSIGGGSFVNRLGQDAVMPDVMFIRDGGRNRLRDYYVDGATEIVVEFLTPGCDAHDLETKRSLYRAAGVPELWTIDSEREQIYFQQWIDGQYQTREPDADGRYVVSSVPGLRFFPARLWIDPKGGDRTWDLFECVTSEADLGEHIAPHGSGVDWDNVQTQFQIGLEPSAIAFADYLWWVPESKFEFAGKPWIGGRDGIKGLTGMLVMSLGMLETLRLFHPKEWVAALLNTRAQVQTDAQRKDRWRSLAHQAAALMRSDFGASRLAVAGDLVASTPLNYWSELYLVTWGLPTDPQASTQLYRALQSLTRNPEIVILEADDDLMPPLRQIIDAGMVEI